MRCLIALVLLAACTNRQEVKVLAAASLTDVLTEIATAYEKNSGEKITLNFGASSILARQIAAGAPADLFLSADEAKMDALAEQRLIAGNTRVSLLSNRLAIIVRADTASRELSSMERIAIAEPSTVPAGIYAKQHLQSQGLWETLAPKIIPTENVRAALLAVETGNADAAIVYTTDARAGKNIRVAQIIENGPPISYPVALIAGAKNANGARRFLQYLRSDEAAATFRRHGFIVNG